MEVTAAATFCATLVDEWARQGVEHAVFSPGSRSTPMVLALDADERIELHRFHDERSAGFAALGIGKASGRPAPVLTTSGTAAVELHPAVVEASYDRVPMIALTADRPPELQGVGAPQTIDQQNLYGRAVRWFCDAGVPDETDPAGWRDLARLALRSALGSPAGPVQLNLPFRDPLLGAAGELPPVDESMVVEPRTREIDKREVDRVAGLLRDSRGVIVAGGHIGDPAPVLALADRLGWPVFADPRSGCRVPQSCVVAHFDALVRCEAVKAAEVEVVLRLGSLPASRKLTEWFKSVDAQQIGVDADGWRFDPDGNLDRLIAAHPDAFCEALAHEVGKVGDHDWVEQWRTWDDVAADTIRGVLDDEEEQTEPEAAREACRHVPDGGVLFVSSSMPIRDVEWYAEPRTGLRILANRGANGIDGILSTAVGVALTGVRTRCLLGDIAFMHDFNAVVSMRRRHLDLKAVVVDNNGGGIFSFLPQHDELEPERYNRLFGTPFIRSLVRDGSRVAAPGVDIITTDREANEQLHAAINEAVRVAIDK